MNIIDLTNHTGQWDEKALPPKAGQLVLWPQASDSREYLEFRAVLKRGGLALVFDEKASVNGLLYRLRKGSI